MLIAYNEDLNFDPQLLKWGAMLLSYDSRLLICGVWLLSRAQYNGTLDFSILQQSMLTKLTVRHRISQSIRQVKILGLLA